MKYRLSIGVFIFLLSLGGLADISQAMPALAQANLSDWSEPVNLSRSETQSNTPALATDAAGGVHVVWSEDFDDGSSYILYTHFEDGNWLTPVEIVTSQDFLVALNPSLAVDSHGVLHLTWTTGENIYYSHAFAGQANMANNWSIPQRLDYSQNYVGSPCIVVDSADNIFLLYSIAFGSNSGIYLTRSADGGLNWSDPTTIAGNARTDRMVDGARLAIGADGTLHAVWVEHNYPETFPAIGIRYAVSRDNGQSWSDALALADGPYHYPAIQTRGEQEVHVVWSGTTTDRYKFHRWSADGGRSWSATWRDMEMGGYQGYGALAVDGSQRLHWLTVGSFIATQNDSLVYTAWQGDHWAGGEAVVRNQIREQNPMDAAAAVALGNELYAVLAYPLAAPERAEGWQMEIYAVQRRLEAEPVAARPLVAPTLVAAARLTETTGTPTTSATPGLNFERTSPKRAAGSGTLTVFLAGTLAAAALAISVIIIYYSRYRRL